MKESIIIIILATCLFAGCDSKKNAEMDSAANNTVTKKTDSASSLPKNKEEKVEVPSEPTPIKKAGTHPIALHWLDWDRPGKATVTPMEDGWYRITGIQERDNTGYLKIDGRIKRLSEKELEFEGSIETQTTTTNNGKPCIKKGNQIFFAKGNRTYYRLQNMENCEGGNLVDYVDIFPGSSSL